MIIIGLTGSIGMGKTTVGSMLEHLGVPVHDADETVHQVLSVGGEAVMAVGAAFPYFSYPQIYGKRNKDGSRVIKRNELGKIVFSNDEMREKLENILHPIVRKSQKDFVRKKGSLGKDIVALDIPLLFETGADENVDVTFVVSAPFHIQKDRVMAREGMTEKKFNAILGHQTPDGEKRTRADFIIETGLGRMHTMTQVKAALLKIRESRANNA